MSERRDRAAEAAQAMRMAETLMRAGVSQNASVGLVLNLTAQKDTEGQTYFIVRAGEYRGRDRSLAGAVLQLLDHAGLA
ncbi:MAG: hypothetical protein HY821_13180 [Acidobacteria bacterium]|nr:hypothetical protein [Acidobacteriota bacterium]